MKTPDLNDIPPHPQRAFEYGYNSAIRDLANSSLNKLEKHLIANNTGADIYYDKGDYLLSKEASFEVHITGEGTGVGTSLSEAIDAALRDCQSK